MGSFSFTTTDGKPFELKGPPNFTFEQAKAIFDKQAATGALVGFKPGDVLSSASQAANGLAGAQATLSQALSGVNNAVGSALGGGALGGSLVSTAAGLTGTVGQAVSSIGKTGAAIAGAAINATSVAVNSIKNINVSLNSPVTNPINNADFIKTVSDGGGALSRIGSMGASAVTGVLAQGKKLVGQASDVLSNTKGVGSFGLDVGQLETAGFLKPGTSKFIESGAQTVSSLLKSPAVWTGKDGIKSVTGILDNAGKQSAIQQDLMAKGVAGLGALGVPVNNLSAQGLGGLALSAAKSLPNTEAFVKGLPLPADVKSTIDSNIRDASFAVNLVDNKMPAAFKETDIPVPATDTVNRETLNAASIRIAGNEKIPPPNYGPREDNVQVQAEEYVSKAAILTNQYINVAGRGLEAVSSKLAELENQQSITQQTYDAINNEFQSIRQAYNAQGPALAAEVNSLYLRLSVTQQRVVDTFDNSPKKTASVISYLLEQSKQIKERLRTLAFKIEGRGDGE